jgi:hypothetical protein
MAIDLAALKTKLAAKRAAEAQTTGEISSENPNNSSNTPSEPSVPSVASVPVPELPAVVVTSTATPGANRTVSIDHMDFFSKMQELQEAIHGQHPKMPVLLMHIHKHLTTDPELVSILSEEEIGVIVSGLKVQTKTELVGTVARQSKARDKKTKLSADMF